MDEKEWGNIIYCDKPGKKYRNALNENPNAFVYLCDFHKPTQSNWIRDENHERTN